MLPLGQQITSIFCASLDSPAWAGGKGGCSLGVIWHVSGPSAWAEMHCLAALQAARKAYILGSGNATWWEELEAKTWLVGRAVDLKAFQRRRWHSVDN